VSFICGSGVAPLLVATYIMYPPSEERPDPRVGCYLARPHCLIVRGLANDDDDNLALLALGGGPTVLVL